MPTLNIVIAIVQPDATHQVGRDRRRCGARDRRDDRAAAASVRKPLPASAIHGPLQSRSFEVLSPPTSASKSSKSFTSAWASAYSRVRASFAPANRTSIRPGSTSTPAGRPDSRAWSASAGTGTRIPVRRALRSSVSRCARRCSSARKAPRFRYVRSYRSNSTRGSVSAWPVSSAPNVRISVAARGPPRDAEQPLEVAAARQQRTVQLLELP